MKRESDKIVVKDGRVVCPVCEHLLPFRLAPNTVLKNLPWKCKHCGQIVKLNIDMSLSH